MRNRFKVLSLSVLGVLFFFNTLAWGIIWDFNKPQVLEVIFFDIGQGDATFIQTFQGHQILIDAGPDSSILEKLGKEMPFWDRSIDLVILTHPHHDHVAGFIDVLNNYKVENILWTGILAPSAVAGKWKNLIDQEGAKIYIAQQGKRITAGQTTLEVFHPFDNLEDEIVEDKDIDQTSLAFQVRFGNNSFLFTGDAPKSVEKELMEKPFNLKANVLKIGHHGSKTSTADEFIQKVAPEFAIISSGKNNRYGHPHEATLDTLNKYDISVLRTDQKGDIKFISDGNNPKISL